MGVETEPRNDVEAARYGARVVERGRLLDLGIFMPVSDKATGTD